jgi:hypothetical protein
MEKQTLSNLMEGKLFNIPDYQRGYAWEEKQWKDFVQDLDALIDDEVVSHYTGTIVIYEKPNTLANYGTRKLKVVDIVDGQQRLTTCCLYLSIIIKELIEKGLTDYAENISTYLYSGTVCKLTLNNETAGFFFDLINKGTTNITADNVHQKRILSAYAYLKEHLDIQCLERNDAIEYLKYLFDAIVMKLNFSFYPIEVESEIGMTFELMNSRGKDLSALELLKNYLMHWVYRNISDEIEKQDFTNLINKTWKEVYQNIARCNGSEKQCLRIAWILYVDYTPKNWKDYAGFKNDNVIPLRDFSKKSKDEIKTFILDFIGGLALISKHYSAIVGVSSKNHQEEALLSKIKNAGNIANFLPLMVAVRIGVEKKTINEQEYLIFLKSLELFSYRVFLWEGKRSNAGISKFARWADDIYTNRQNLITIIDWIYANINWYSNENKFRNSLDAIGGWYQKRRLLKYTLFEYELYLLSGRYPSKIAWEDLTDSTIEHILPQTPAPNSSWLQNWANEDFILYLHDISNLVLTKDNSRYSNFEFDRKKGTSGTGFCYSNSEISQEREISKYAEWTVKEANNRRDELVAWILKNWGMDKYISKITTDIEDNEDEDVEFVESD